MAAFAGGPGEGVDAIAEHELHQLVIGGMKFDGILAMAEPVERTQLRLIAVGEPCKVLHALVAGKLARVFQMRRRVFSARAPDGLDQRDVAFEQID